MSNRLSSPRLRSGMRLLSVIGAMILNLGLAGASVETARPARLLVDLSSRPAPLGLSAFDLCILRVDAQVDLEAAHALGHKALARVPLLEVPAVSAAAALAKELGVPLLETEVAGLVRLDATHPRWVHVVVHELVETAAERGFDGVVLADLETLSQDAERAAVLRLLPLLKSAYPDKKLFVEEGFLLLPEARRHLDGMVFFEEQAAKSSPESILRLERRIQGASRMGVTPYVVGFEDPEKPSDIAARTARIRQLGGVPFFTTPELKGANLGPLQEVSRRVLVLHSGPAAETYSAQVLHGCLEWLGYEVVYRDAGQPEAGAGMPGHHGFSAVILDQTLALSAERQHALAELVTAVAQRKVPLLITGLPWQQPQDWNRVSQSLGLAGSGRELPSPLSKTRFEQLRNDWLMNPGAVAPRTSGLRDLRVTAVEGVESLLSLKSEGAEYTQVALTPWGGLWLDPLALEAGPQIHPLPFLEKMLSKGALAPVMDTTSLDGRRLLVTHVDSEGFAETSDLPGMPLAAEAMLEKVVSRYALPMTVAVSEADVRGWTPGTDPRQALRFQEAARRLFALPNVEPASATLSRPQGWKGAEATAGSLNASAQNPASTLEREVGGSLAFLHRQLLGRGGRMHVLSWPRESLPSAEAVAFTRRVGVESLMQQNRFLMAGRTQALPVRGWGAGDQFSTVLQELRAGQELDAETFIADARRAGEQRWLAPVQVNLRFADAASASRLSQVEKILDWCASQPFQALTVGEYARLMRDAAHTRIFQTSADRWVVVNEGLARTLRLPAAAGVPDLARCTGVSGFTRQGDQLYIHTLGLRRTELVMRREAERDYLRLASSSGSVKYLEAGSSRALLKVHHTRPVEMTFEGILPGTICQLVANGTPDYIMADTAGRIEFTVPGQSTVQLRLLPDQKAAMR